MILCGLVLIRGDFDAPERDKLSMSYEQMTSRLAICMGGRVSEELVFGKEKITSGAQSDIEAATKLARAMVTQQRA